jgi:hypothetical protein
MTVTEKKIVDRDSWDEVVIHMPGNMPPTLIKSSEQFTVEDEVLVIRYSEAKLPSSKDGDNFVPASAEVQINLFSALRIEFFKAKKIATPKSMIIAP